MYVVEAVYFVGCAGFGLSTGLWLWAFLQKWYLINLGMAAAVFWVRCGQLGTDACIRHFGRDALCLLAAVAVHAFACAPLSGPVMVFANRLILYAAFANWYLAWRMPVLEWACECWPCEHWPQCFRFVCASLRDVEIITTTAQLFQNGDGTRLKIMFEHRVTASHDRPPMHATTNELGLTPGWLWTTVVVYASHECLETLPTYQLAVVYSVWGPQKWRRAIETCVRRITDDTALRDLFGRAMAADIPSGSLDVVDGQTEPTTAAEIVSRWRRWSQLRSAWIRAVVG